MSLILVSFNNNLESIHRQKRLCGSCGCRHVPQDPGGASFTHTDGTPALGCKGPGTARVSQPWPGGPRNHHLRQSPVNGTASMGVQVSDRHHRRGQFVRTGGGDATSDAETAMNLKEHRKSRKYDTSQGTNWFPSSSFQDMETYDLLNKEQKIAVLTKNQWATGKHRKTIQWLWLCLK